MRTKALLLVFAALTTGSAGANDDFEAARRAYERGDYPRAQTRLQAAAIRGDARAQELLGFMHAFGPQLFPGVNRNDEVAARWFDRAARSGRPAARYMFCALTRRVPSTRPADIYCFDRVAESGQAPARLAKPLPSALPH